MKNYLFYAIGAIALITGCSQEEFPDKGANTKSENFPENGITQEGTGIQGIAYVKLKPSVNEEVRKVSLQGVSLNNAPSALSASLQSIKATGMRRLFRPDPRFEGRTHRSGLDRWYIINFSEKQNLDQTLQSLSGSAQFEYVEKVYPTALPSTKVIPASAWSQPITRSEAESYPFNDPGLPDQWHYQNFGKTEGAIAGADINLFEAWKTTTGKPQVIVGVIDGGIDVTHEDLVDNLWTNTNEIAGDGLDNDNNGYVDDIHGFNFVSATGNITPTASEGHGTHVAGTVAARNNNGIGVSGVAGGDGTPGSGILLMSCEKFEGTPSGDTGVPGEEAFYYSANNGAVISQNSWGYLYPGPGSLPQSMKEAIDYFIEFAGCDDEGKQLPDSPMKGGVVIFSAGNDGKDFMAYPGAYDAVIAVSAMAPDWQTSYYSNRGAWVDIMAPGGDARYDKGQVLSTLPPSLHDGMGYGYMQGTSMACPHVSGIAALIVSHFGGQGFTNEDLKKRLLGSLRPENIDEHNPQYVGRLGTGYIDATRVFAENQGIKPGNVTDLLYESDFKEITFHWTAVADEDDGAPVKYMLYFSEEPITSSEPTEKLQSYRINATGVAPGSSMNYTVASLKPSTRYYAAVVAVDRWEQVSDLQPIEVSTKTNHAPEIDGAPTEMVRVRKNKETVVSLNISDPDGHKMSFRLKGEMRGVTGKRTENRVDLTFKAVAPVGEYKLEFMLVDELGASSSVEIPFKVVRAQEPIALSMDNVVAESEESIQPIDLTRCFSYEEDSKVTFSAQSSDPKVVATSLEGNLLNLNIKGMGYSQITVKADVEGTIVTNKFDMWVVTDKNSLIYHLYPQPAVTELNLMLNKAAKNGVVSIRSLMGEKVYEQSYKTGSDNILTIDVNRFAAGTYTLQVKAATGTAKKTFIKQ